MITCDEPYITRSSDIASSGIPLLKFVWDLWHVQDTAGSDSIRIASINIEGKAAQDIDRCWEILQQGSRGLIESKEHLMSLIREVLSFDMRSLCRRQKNCEGARAETAYHVLLAGLDLQYHVCGSTVNLVSARCEPSVEYATTRWGWQASNMQATESQVADQFLKTGFAME
jgi:hypothetical protein